MLWVLVEVVWGLRKLLKEFISWSSLCVVDWFKVNWWHADCERAEQFQGWRHTYRLDFSLSTPPFQGRAETTSRPTYNRTKFDGKCIDLSYKYEVIASYLYMNVISRLLNPSPRGCWELCSCNLGSFIWFSTYCVYIWVSLIKQILVCTGLTYSYQKVSPFCICSGSSNFVSAGGLLGLVPNPASQGGDAG